ncbi:MAG: hypothetical protein KAU12_00395, partial [Candidatus Omnitrophica bacterium]|nr:hypothetical protein [Candidatus Omnitrophota bacterium]
VGTNEYTATRMAWPYYICKRLKKDPWVEKDLHISLYSAKNYRAMFCEAGFEVLKVHYNMINFIPFIFLFPRREDELYTMYPELKNMPLVRFTEIVRRIIEFVLPVKIILIGFGLLISKILLLLWKKPFGGTYFKLKKV